MTSRTETQTTGWRYGLTVAVVAVIAPTTAAVYAGITKSAEVQLAAIAKDKEIDLARREKDAEMRMAALDRAIDPARPASDRQQVLRFLVSAISDPDVKAWATDELKRVDQEVLDLRDKLREAEGRLVDLSRREAETKIKMIRQANARSLEREALQNAARIEAADRSRAEENRRLALSRLEGVTKQEAQARVVIDQLKHDMQALADRSLVAERQLVVEKQQLMEQTALADKLLLAEKRRLEAARLLEEKRRADEEARRAAWDFSATYTGPF